MRFTAQPVPSYSGVWKMAALPSSTQRPSCGWTLCTLCPWLPACSFSPWATSKLLCPLDTAQRPLRRLPLGAIPYSGGWGSCVCLCCPESVSSSGGPGPILTYQSPLLPSFRQPFHSGKFSQSLLMNLPAINLFYCLLFGSSRHRPEAEWDSYSNKRSMII